MLAFICFMMTALADMDAVFEINPAQGIRDELKRGVCNEVFAVVTTGRFGNLGTWVVRVAGDHTTITHYRNDRQKFVRQLTERELNSIRSSMPRQFFAGENIDNHTYDALDCIFLHFTDSSERRIDVNAPRENPVQARKYIAALNLFIRAGERKGRPAIKKK